MAFHIKILKKAINQEKQVFCQLKFPNFCFCKNNHLNYMAELLQAWFWSHRGPAGTPGKPTNYYLGDIE